MSRTVRDRMLHRLGQSAGFIARTLLPAVTGMLLSWMVIHRFSPGIWGSIVSHTLWVYVLSAIANWGSRDFLLRSFSETPANISPLFTSSILIRLLLFPLWLLILLWHSGDNGQIFLICALWLLARYWLLGFDGLLTYFKKFRTALLIEAGGSMLVLTLVLVFPGEPNTADILWMMLAADLLRGFFMAWVFRKYLTLRFRPGSGWFHLSRAWSFVLIGALGILASRSDQFLVFHYLSDDDKALYQVLMNMLLLLMVLPGALLMPLLKNLYRSGDAVFVKVQRSLVLNALWIVPAGSLASAACVHFIYDFPLSTWQWIITIILVFPVYVYVTPMYRMYKEHKEYMVAIASLSGLIVCFGLGVFIIPGAGITAALISAAAGQWIIMLMVITLRWIIKTKEKQAAITVQQ